MTPAESARANAISLEVKKDGLAQRQSGDWVVRLTVAGIDMHERIMKAPMGTRFVCVLVEVDDNEEPKEAPAQEQHKPSPEKAAGLHSPSPEDRPHFGKSYAQRIAITCGERAFQVFLYNQGHNFHCDAPAPGDKAAAAAAVRKFCEVDSRREIREGTKAGNRWLILQSGYRAWMDGPRAGVA